MSGRTYNVLFLCTGNSARSIFAECPLRQLGKGILNGFSAGSFPKGEVHPLALRLLREQGFSTAGLRSKSWMNMPRQAHRQWILCLRSATRLLAGFAPCGLVIR
jgi:protein-tyrosine-phosphatase